MVNLAIIIDFQSRNASRDSHIYLWAAVRADRPLGAFVFWRGAGMDWGRYGSTTEHQRYMEPVKSKSRQRCHCGCKTQATHLGMANGLALMSGCDLYVRRWVRDGINARRVVA